MGLTSNNTLVLTVLVAVALFAGTVWLWPRLARRGWRPVSGRIGLLFATQLSLFVSLGLAANHAYGFYASWADLFGRETDQGVVVDHTPGNRSRGPLKVTEIGNVPGREAFGRHRSGRFRRSTSSAPRHTSPAPRTSICRRSISRSAIARVPSPRPSCSPVIRAPRERWWTNSTIRAPLWN